MRRNARFVGLVVLSGLILLLGVATERYVPISVLAVLALWVMAIALHRHSSAYPKDRHHEEPDAGTPPVATAREREELRLAEMFLAGLRPGAAREERLRGARVSLAAVVEVVQASLARDPFFPPGLKSEDLGHGAIIERRRGGVYVVHQRFEIGQMRFSEVSCSRHFSLRGAVRRYLNHHAALLKVDGVTVG